MCLKHEPDEINWNSKTNIVFHAKRPGDPFTWMPHSLGYITQVRDRGLVCVSDGWYGSGDQKKFQQWKPEVWLRCVDRVEKCNMSVIIYMSLRYSKHGMLFRNPQSKTNSSSVFCQMWQRKASNRHIWEAKSIDYYICWFVFCFFSILALRSSYFICFLGYN